MTDITNQEKRTAIEVSEAIERGDYPMADMWPIMARVILATVEAPEPTLSEGLRYRADLLDNGDPDGDTANVLRTLATDAAQMEQERDDLQDIVDGSADDLQQRDDEIDRLIRERDKARAEVERLTAQNTWPKNTPLGHTYDAPTTYPELRHQCANAGQAASEGWDDAERPPEPKWKMVELAIDEVEDLCDSTMALTAERDEALAKATLWKGEYEEMSKSEQSFLLDLTDAETEVKRLTTERDLLKAQVQGLARRDGNHNSEVRMLTEERDEALAEVERLTAERDTNTETHSDNAVTDPADVKPGEAWIVEVEGRRRTAVKDNGGAPWNTVTAGGLFSSERNEAVTPITRLASAPRVITDPDPDYF